MSLKMQQILAEQIQPILAGNQVALMPHGEVNTQNPKPRGLRGAEGSETLGVLAWAWQGSGGKGRGYSPKQTPCVCHHQLDATAVTELTHP